MTPSGMRSPDSPTQLLDLYAPGQLFSPPRSDDPGTDGRQGATGYLGLQAHSTSDVVTFRDIRVQPL